MAHPAVKFSPEALRLHAQFAQQVARDGTSVRVADLGRDSRENLGYDRPLSRDQAGPQGAGYGHSSGLSQAFRAHNEAAKDLYGTPGQEQGPGPHTPMTASVQEGTSAIGGPRGPVEEGIDTKLHGGYRRAWKIGSRDSMEDPNVEVVRNPVGAGDEYVDEEGRSSTESGVSPGNVGTNLKDSGVKAGLHSEAVDSYGELAGGLFEIDPKACAALEALLVSQGFTPADAKMIVRQHLLAPMQKANYESGTGAPAQDEPPDLPGGGQPTPGGTQTALKADRCIVGDESLNRRNEALRLSDRVGYAFSSDAQPGRLRRDRHREHLEHLAGRDDLPLAKQLALDHLKAEREGRTAKPSEVFANSGASRIGWAA
jgi:hypothetical protein